MILSSIIYCRKESGNLVGIVDLKKSFDPHVQRRKDGSNANEYY